MPDEEVINNGKTGKERNVDKEILVTGGLGRKRQLQVIRTSSNIARAKKVARFNETFPQAELRRLEQVEVRQLTELLRHHNSPKLGVDVMLNIWQLNGLLRHPNSSQIVFSRRLTWRLREI
ncbi:hypothetical protein TNCV_35241 [Trichonephila clavipes]|nr:hypothetical protein TNCV_35241 [Trichonephila clavipes]